jgi:hypothetical protein
LQVDECGLPIPRTLARMASERSVKIFCGPKRSQWRIEADIDKEAQINQRIAEGKNRAQSILMTIKSQQGQRAASMRALSILRTAESLRTASSVESGEQRQMNSGSAIQTLAAPESPLDPARLTLPMLGFGEESLRLQLAKLQRIDDSSLSNQVASNSLFQLELCKISYFTVSA